MGTTLYLTEARARRDYICEGCGSLISRGDPHFRHDPYPRARMGRGEQRSHWCPTCITDTPSVRDQIGRLWIRPSTLVRAHADRRRQLELELVRVEVVGIGGALADRIAGEPSLVHRLTPAQFQEFVCDRLSAMGMEPQQVGSTFRKDGGIDIVFWPRAREAFPFLGAVQVKHHRDPSVKEGPAAVRDFAGSIAGHPFGAALLVTNTKFTPDARWFASERAKLIRLRDFDDLCRWMENNFSAQEEWREIPRSIELCPGVVVRIRG